MKISRFPKIDSQMDNPMVNVHFKIEGNANIGVSAQMPQSQHNILDDAFDKEIAEREARSNQERETARQVAITHFKEAIAEHTDPQDSYRLYVNKVLLSLCEDDSIGPHIIDFAIEQSKDLCMALEDADKLSGIVSFEITGGSHAGRYLRLPTDVTERSEATFTNHPLSGYGLV